MITGLRPSKSALTCIRDYHVIILGPTSPMGRLVVEYFARVIQNSLKWAIADLNDAEMDKAIEELALPVGYSVSKELLHMNQHRNELIKRTHTIIQCQENSKEALLNANVCALEGTNWIGNCSHPSLLRRLSSLHILAKQNQCCIVPSSTYEVTLAELGIAYLAKQFSPGELLEAALFEFLPQTYSGLLLASMHFASRKLHMSHSSSQSHVSKMVQSKSLGRIPNSEHRPSQILLSPTNNSSLCYEKIKPASSLFNLDTHSYELRQKRLDSASSIAISGGFSKTKSFDDVSSMESFRSIMPSPRSATDDNERKKTGSKVRVKTLASESIAESITDSTYFGIFPTYSSVIRGKILSNELLRVPQTPASTENGVVLSISDASTALLVPSDNVQLPTELHSTVYLPDPSRRPSSVEANHLIRSWAMFRVFLALCSFFVILFSVFPLSHRIWTAFMQKYNPYNFSSSLEKTRGNNNSNINGSNVLEPTERLLQNEDELNAKTRFYISASPSTMTKNALSIIDPNQYYLKPLGREFLGRHTQRILVGGRGTGSSYIASSSTQSSEKIKYVQVTSPPYISKHHLSAITMSLCALAVSTSPKTRLFSSSSSSSADTSSSESLNNYNSACDYLEPDSTYGVLPPLSAGGKALMDELVYLGVGLQSVSLGKGGYK